MVPTPGTASISRPDNGFAFLLLGGLGFRVEAYGFTLLSLVWGLGFFWAWVSDGQFAASGGYTRLSVGFSVRSVHVKALGLSNLLLNRLWILALWQEWSLLSGIVSFGTS